MSKVKRHICLLLCLCFVIAMGSIGVSAYTTLAEAYATQGNWDDDTYTYASGSIYCYVNCDGRKSTHQASVTGTKLDLIAVVMVIAGDDDGQLDSQMMVNQYLVYLPYYDYFSNWFFSKDYAYTRANHQ